MIELLVIDVSMPGGRSYAEITIVSVQLEVNSTVVVAIDVLSVTVWLKAPDVTDEVILQIELFNEESITIILPVRDAVLLDNVSVARIV